MNRNLRTDFLISDKYKQPILAIEVKINSGVSVEWATTLRRNLFAHGFYHLFSYFLLVTPDKFFLWKTRKDNNNLSKPDYVINAKPIIGKYISSTGLTIEELNGREFELIISSWISDLLSIQNLKDFPHWMIESGLAESIKEGFYELETV